MKILVTGGAGFLGSHLCKKLLESNYEVIALDNLFTGYKKNIDELFAYKNFDFIEHDITSPINIKIDAIFNLACPASPEKYQIDPVQTMKTSVLGSINMLELALQNNARILQSSTSEIYGDPKISPQEESYWGNVNPIGVRSCYDEGKRAAETIFNDYHSQHKADIRIARIFNTYGPNMSASDGRVVSNFIVQALENKNLTVYGTGKQTRSFCYVDDLIDGLIALFQVEKIHTPVNLGNPEPINMLDLAKEIIKITESDSNIIYKDLPDDDPVDRLPDITKANQLLNWEPKINRKTGLISTIKYFKETIK
jgi:UDP-glucuronate decarboxylase